MSRQSCMHRLVLPSVLLPLIAVALTAQGYVGLSLRSGPTTSAAFSPAKLGNGIMEVSQVSMVPHPNGTPSLFLGGMTVRGLPPGLGGVGDRDVVAFTYDRGTDTVTMNADAAALNTAYADVSLSWSSDGTYATYCQGRPTVQPIAQAMATTPGGVLGVPKLITPTLSNVDPTPGVVDGNRVLFFAMHPNLVQQRHDVANAALLGAPSVVTLPITTGDIAHSPWPLHGIDGRAKALLGCNTSSGTSDWNWQGDMDGATSPLVASPLATTGFRSNGCEAGGRVYMAESGAASRIVEWEVVGMLGDTVKSSGGVVFLTAFAPTKPAGSPDFTVFAIADTHLAFPLVFPGIQNRFGLGSTFSVLGTATHTNAHGRGTLIVIAPPLPPLSIAVQGLTVIGGAPGEHHFTSTAAVVVVP